MVQTLLITNRARYVTPLGAVTTDIVVIGYPTEAPTGGTGVNIATVSYDSTQCWIVPAQLGWRFLLEAYSPPAGRPLYYGRLTDLTAAGGWEWMVLDLLDQRGRLLYSGVSRPAPPCANPRRL